MICQSFVDAFQSGKANSLNRPPDTENTFRPELESRWHRLAQELREIRRHKPPSLAEAEELYATSTPVPLTREWIESICMAVQAQRTNLSNVQAPAEFRFMTSTWHIYSDGSDWHYEAIAMTLAPESTSEALAAYQHQYWDEN